MGFYFSFLDFYTWALVPPALVGVALMLFLPGGGATDSAKSSQPAAPEEEEAGLAMSGYMVQAVFSMVWSTIFMELWKRRSSALSHCWGVLSLAERFAEPRPGFQGTLGVNPVTKRVEPLFPEWRRQMRVGLGSLPVVVLFLGLVLLGMAGFYQGETLAKQLHQDWGSLLSGALLYLPSMLHIFYTNMLSTLYGRVALKLTEWGERGRKGGRMEREKEEEGGREGERGRDGKGLLRWNYGSRRREGGGGVRDASRWSVDIKGWRAVRLIVTSKIPEIIINNSQTFVQNGYLL